MIEMFKLFSDELRLRILMLLDKQELSVCQIMGIIGASQPLISRNLSLLYRAGFLDERREGKLRFYSISKGLSDEKASVIELLRKLLKSDKLSFLCIVILFETTTSATAYLLLFIKNPLFRKSAL